MKRALAITDNLKSSVNAYLIARAYAETQREIVDKIQRKILGECKYYIAEEWVERLGEKRERITEPKDTFLMDEDDFLDYYLNVRKDLEKAGYEIESTADPEHPHSYKCPALSAEWTQTQAEHLVIDSMAEMLGEDDLRHRLLCAGLNKYHQFLDLAVKFVVNSPGWVAPKV